MRCLLLPILLLTGLQNLFAQDNIQNATVKYDFHFAIANELGHFSDPTFGLEVRRRLNTTWTIKLGFIGERKFDKQTNLDRRTFPLSDSTFMRRNEILSIRLNNTFQFGVDFIDLKRFTIGAQLIYGKARGYSSITDRIFYDLDEEEYYGWSGYSEELTMAYHEPTLNPVSGIANIGSWTGTAAIINYRVIGGGFTFEAKWPFLNHFEAALQYRPELLHFSVKNSTIYYERDANITTEFNGHWEFYHTSQLLLRYSL